AVLAPGGAWGGTGDVVLPAGIGVGDAVATLRIAGDFALEDPRADVFPPSASGGVHGDCLFTTDDAARVLVAALGVATIEAETIAPPSLLSFYRGSLHAVDPPTLDESGALLVDAGPVAQESDLTFGLVGAEWDTSGGAPVLRNLGMRRAFYVRPSDQTFWKVDATRVEVGGAVVAPVPERLSTQAGAVICEMDQGPDFTDPDAFSLVYRTPGGDGVCNDDMPWMDANWLVRAGMGPTDAPIPTPVDPITVVIDPATGAVGGWLGFPGPELHLYTPDFGSSEGLGVTASSYVWTLELAVGGYIYLSLDGHLVILDAAAHTVVSSSYEFANADGRGFSRRGDGTRLFFLDLDASAGGAVTLFQADPDGTVTALDAPADASGSQTGRSLVIPGATRVLYAYATGFLTSTLASVDKTTGGDRRVLDTGILTPFTITNVGGQPWLFYQAFEGGHTRARAVDINDGNLALDLPDALWIGATLPSDGAAVSYSIRPDRMLLASGIKAFDDVSEASVLSFDASDPTAAPIRLGRVPADLPGVFLGPSFGPDLLGVGIAGNGSTDILYANAERACSLRRVTETSASEVPLTFF
ncbi:MAG: hypothetical protein KC466_13690, partial [Myxococcales bacterium]|nr:hypothetical protein [Myxococcales bacterium]